MHIPPIEIRMYLAAARCAGLSPAVRRQQITHQHAVQSLQWPRHVTPFERLVSRLMERFESWWTFTQRSMPRRQRRRWTEADLRSWLTSRLAHARSEPRSPMTRPGPAIAGCACECHR